MDGQEVSHALNDQSAGQFMMFNPDGMLVFSNSKPTQLCQTTSSTRYPDGRLVGPSDGSEIRRSEDL
ncbi:hypothetical protein AEQ48_09925 [Pseudomonas libanensis]|uniref:Uncharacterized protein n=1 Tax=Pseudomonas libanensis TaxID=75588 RepID=A0ABR5M9A0_9PSED|nr:hypothetical protein AEQ48_09925 [Pseudomonas libanensis]